MITCGSKATRRDSTAIRLVEGLGSNHRCRGFFSGTARIQADALRIRPPDTVFNCCRTRYHGDYSYDFHDESTIENDTPSQHGHSTFRSTQYPVRARTRAPCGIEPTPYKPGHMIWSCIFEPQYGTVICLGGWHDGLQIKDDPPPKMAL